MFGGLYRLYKHYLDSTFMDRIEIPNSVIGTVAEVLGSYYYSHTRLNTLFMENGAPGEPPVGNCVTKCSSWLKQCNFDSSVHPLEVLGGVLQKFMDEEFSDSSVETDWKKGQDRIRRVLAKNGFSYQQNGQILTAGFSPSIRALAEILRAGELSSVDAEFQRALGSVELDPPTGVTAACAIIEALCKTYIEDKHLVMPDKKTIKDLWKVVRDHLGLDPSIVIDDDKKRILSGLASIVDGVGSLRTHAGSAHGHGRTQQTVTPSDARLAINAAHTLTVYVIELWKAVDKVAV